MLVDRTPDITVDMVQAALPLARELFDEQWLTEQAQNRTTDSLLLSQLPILSQRGIARALREGLPQAGIMHPLAEAVIGSERVVEYHEKTGIYLSGLFVYRLLSLRDVALHIDGVSTMRDRISRLKGEQWQSALYELLVACSQARATSVELLPEGNDASPDMRLGDLGFLECKAKLQHDERVALFRNRFNRFAHDKIFQEASKIGNGLLVEIEVHDEGKLASIPGLLRSMFDCGIKRRATPYAKVKVTPYQSGPFDLPENMSVHSARFWQWMMGFDGWHDWHVVSPYAEAMLSNASNLIAESVRRPVLVCARSTTLANAEQNIRATVAAACRRQLREHHPGIVRVHVNSALYGIGANAKVPKIRDSLGRLADNLLASYSRLVGIRFDITTPPVPGELSVNYTSVATVRAGEEAHYASILSTPGVVLV